jgi:hypothetical protein
MKYIQKLRRNSIIKHTLLGKILNMRSKNSIEFVTQEGLRENIKDSQAYKRHTLLLLKDSEKPENFDDWSHNKRYEDNLDGKSDYSPHFKDNKLLIEEFKRISRRENQNSSRFRAEENKIEEKDDSHSHSDTEEGLHRELTKLKSLERRKTPNVDNNNRLDGNLRSKFKKSSTNLKMALDLHNIPNRKIKDLHFMKKCGKLLKEAGISPSGRNSPFMGTRRKIEEREKYYENMLNMLIIKGETNKLIDLLNGVALIQESILSKLFEILHML